MSSTAQADATSSVVTGRISSASFGERDGGSGSVIQPPTKIDDTVVNQGFRMTCANYCKDVGMDASSPPPRPPPANTCAPNAPAQGLSSVVHEDATGSIVARRIFSASVKNKDSTIPPYTVIAGRVVNQGFETTCTKCGNDVGVDASPPPAPAHVGAPAQGGSLKAGVEPRSGASMAKNNRTGCAAQANQVPEDEDHCDRNVPKNNDNLNENDVAKTIKHEKKPKRTSSQAKPKHHIRWNGFSQLFADPPPVPLGERCQLCNIDLAFVPIGSDSQPTGTMCSAVLPCSHAYHDSCLQNLFGLTEPPCIRCLDVEAKKGVETVGGLVSKSTTFS